MTADKKKKLYIQDVPLLKIHRVLLATINPHCSFFFLFFCKYKVCGYCKVTLMLLKNAYVIEDVVHAKKKNHAVFSYVRTYF